MGGRKKKCEQCGGELSEVPVPKVAGLAASDPCTAVEQVPLHELYCQPSRDPNVYIYMSIAQELGSVVFLHCRACTEHAQWGAGGTLDAPALYAHWPLKFTATVVACRHALRS